MNSKAAAWLLLITNLPGRNPTLRMRIWRALKAAGAGLLRDGVYVLPNSAASRRVFEEQGGEIKAGSGFVQIVSFEAESPEQNVALVVLFDRTTEYQEAIRRLDAFKRELPKRKETEARQRLTAMGREVGTLVAQDFFPGQARGQMEAALADAEAALNARFAPDEPHAAHRKVPRREINRLTQALNDSNTPPYIYNGLKREQLIRTGSVVLHELYFGNLGGDGKASAELRSRIAASFGTFDAWESEFRKVGQGLGGGSGWVVLGFNERLKLLENYWLADHASNPPDTRPILVMDMYEHAYQMDYGAAAPKYIDAFFTNINWDAVANRM